MKKSEHFIKLTFDTSISFFYFQKTCYATLVSFHSPYPHYQMPYHYVFTFVFFSCILCVSLSLSFL